MISSTGRARKTHTTNFNNYIKQILSILAFIFLLASLYFFGAHLKNAFPIKTVKVYGIQHADQQLVQDALSPLVNKGFFAIDVENIKDRLQQSAWISKAMVQRVWPNEVLITIVEKTPVAYWNGSQLLSSRGEVFNPDNAFLGDLPQLVGPPGQHIQLFAYYQKLNSLLNHLHFKITHLALSSDLIWNVTLDNGIKISANHKDLLTRMDRFVKVYPKIIGHRVNDVEYVDLRYSNGLAVRWKTVI